MNREMENLIADAICISGSVAELLAYHGGGDSIPPEAGFGIRYLAQETYRMVCEIRGTAEALEDKIQKLQADYDKARMDLDTAGDDLMHAEIELAELKEKYGQAEAELTELRKKDLPHAVDDDPDWVVNRKAEAYLEEKKLQESPQAPEEKEEFPVPVGSEKAKEICNRIRKENEELMVDPKTGAMKRKKGRPKKGEK